MDLDDLAAEAFLNHEIFIPMLYGLAKEVGGEKQLAGMVGIYPEQLSAYLNLSNPPPGPKIAERIAQALPIDPEERRLLHERMLRASERRLQLGRRLRRERTERTLSESLQSLKQLYREGEHSRDPQTSKIRRLTIRELGRAAIQQADARADPLALVEILAFLQHIESILNRPLAALDCAMRARDIMLNLDRRDYRRELRRFDELRVNSCRIVAVAYHNLHLFNEASDSLKLAERQEGTKLDPDRWIPDLNRDKIYALSGQPRFSIRQAKELAEQAERIYERGRAGDAASGFFDFSRALATAYLQHQNLKKAKQVLEAQLPNLGRLPRVGLLDQTMFLKTCALLRKLEGDDIEWSFFIRQAIRINLEAGFTHQLHEIRQEYGREVEPLIEELEAVEHPAPTR